jgi:hypothetical protein
MLEDRSAKGGDEKLGGWRRQWTDKLEGDNDGRR